MNSYIKEKLILAYHSVSFNYGAPEDEPQKIKTLRNIFLVYILIAMFGRHILMFYRWGLAFLGVHALEGEYLLAFEKYQTMPAMIWIHIFTGMFFHFHCLLQIAPKSWEYHKSFHRINGRLALINFFIMIITALLLSKNRPMFPTLHGFTMFINTLSVFFLCRGIYFLQKKNYFIHRNNMLRIFLISFGNANQDIFARIWGLFDFPQYRALFDYFGFYAYLVPIIVLEIFYIRKKETFFLPKGFRK